VDKRRWMSLIECLKLENEPKSTRSAGKLFQRFTTRSAKKLHVSQRAMTEVEKFHFNSKMPITDKTNCHARHNIPRPLLPPSE